MSIAFDAVSNSEGSAITSLTFSHTCSGQNRILFVGINILLETDSITGITYNGVSMTRIDYQANVGNTESSYLYYLINPSSGANNIVISSSSSTTIRASSVSYTGAKQSSQPDASAKQNSSATTSHSLAVTTVADNCWVVSWCAVAGSLPAASTNVTSRHANTARGIGDSNGVVTPPASFAQTWTSPDSRASVQIHASIAPTLEGGAALFMV